MGVPSSSREVESLVEGGKESRVMERVWIRERERIELIRETVGQDEVPKSELIEEEEKERGVERAHPRPPSASFLLPLTEELLQQLQRVWGFTE